jgi:O-antigen/teichoic acid export membrane protein
MLKEAVRHSTFTTIGSLANAVIGLLFAGFTIRFLGDQRAGFLLLIQSIMGIGSATGGLGLGTAATRRIALLEAKSQLPEAALSLGVVLSVNMIVGLVIFILLFFGFPWIFQFSKIDFVFRTDAFYACFFLALTFVMQQISSAYSIVFPGLRRYDLVAAISTISGILSGGGGLLILTINRSMTALAAFSLIVGLLILAINVFISNRLMRMVILPKWNLSVLRSLLRFGGWVYLEQIFSLLAGGVDKILLTTFLGSGILPYYSIGQRVVTQVHALLSGQSQYLFPMLAAKGNQISSAIETVEDRLRWFVGFISAMIYGVLTLVAYPLLAILIGDTFARQAFIPFVIACLQGFLVAYTVVPYFITYAEGHPAPNALIVPINSLLVFVTMLLLIPKLGVLGASLAQLWIGPTGFILIVWIMLVGKRFSWKRLFRPLVSPTAIWILLLSIAWAAWSLKFEGKLFFLLLTAGGIFSIAGGFLIEHRFFGKYKCLETLTAAVKLLLHRFVPVSRIY